MIIGVGSLNFAVLLVRLVWMNKYGRSFGFINNLFSHIDPCEGICIIQYNEQVYWCLSRRVVSINKN